MCIILFFPASGLSEWAGRRVVAAGGSGGGQCGGGAALSPGGGPQSIHCYKRQQSFQRGDSIDFIEIYYFWILLISLLSVKKTII